MKALFVKKYVHSYFLEPGKVPPIMVSSADIDEAILLSCCVGSQGLPQKSGVLKYAEREGAGGSGSRSGARQCECVLMV